LVNNGQLDYLALYLAGDSSVGTLTSLEKGKSRLAAVHRRPDGFWNFPKLQSLNGIKQFMHNHTIFSMLIRLKIKLTRKVTIFSMPIRFKQGINV